MLKDMNVIKVTDLEHLKDNLFHNVQTYEDLQWKYIETIYEHLRISDKNLKDANDMILRISKSHLETYPMIINAFEQMLSAQNVIIEELHEYYVEKMKELIKKI